MGFSYSSGTTFKHYKLLPEVSIFTAETQVIKGALIYASSITSNKILIISDSLSALIVLESSNSSNEIIQQIHRITATTSHIIKCTWVPSPTGIMGSEKVDLLTYETITSSSSQNVYSLSYQNILKIINSHTSRIWQDSREALSTTDKLRIIKKLYK